MTEQLVQLADEAASYFPAQLAKAGEVLDRAAARRSADPKVQHNAAITGTSAAATRAGEIARDPREAQAADRRRARRERERGGHDRSDDATPTRRSRRTIRDRAVPIEAGARRPGRAAHPRADGPAAAARPPHPRARPPAAARAARPP